MFMKPRHLPGEKGQNIVLIAILMLVFIGILALALDGGMAYAKRRSAQNAADAGALAGANQLCAVNPGDPVVIAKNYAIARNGALKADVQVVGHEITVTAYMSQQTFFARLLGNDVITETATASAGCSGACAGTGVMPVAWACKSPIDQPGAGCVLTDTVGTFDDPGPLYIVMDSNVAAGDYQCQDPIDSGLPTGALDCDFIGTGYDYNGDGIYDGDGINDLITGGGRSWLDLTGSGGGSSELTNWISNGFPEELKIHTWVTEQSGTANSIFQAAADLIVNNKNIVILPVFNNYTPNCNPYTNPTAPGCVGKWDSQDTIKTVSNSSAPYYHISAFSSFKITGVSTPGVGNNITTPQGEKFKCEGDCTAKIQLVDQCKLDPTLTYCIHKDPVTGQVLPGFDPNIKTIEGYFLSGFIPGLLGRCDSNVDTGAYTIYLSH